MTDNIWKPKSLEEIYCAQKEYYDSLKLCPVCMKGKMHQLSFQLTSNPPQYPYRCDNEECNYYATSY